MPKDKPEPVGKMESDGKWTKTTRVWIPEISNERRIKVERLKSELDLANRAASDGRDNRPLYNDSVLNEPQMDICSHVFSGILMLNEFLAEQVGLAVKNARALMPPRFNAEHPKDLISGAIEKTFHDHRRDLIGLRQTELDRRRALRYFRYKNSLTREAEYRDSVILVFAIILAMFIIESLLNGTLFSQVVSTGLIGGAMLAGMISAINIVSGIAGGYFGWRFIGHKKIILKLLGIVITTICHFIAIFWNLLVAHFREVAENLAASDNFNFDPAQLTSGTVAHIQAHGIYGVESLQSWALLVLGVFIHFFAAKEGWDNIADRYPDYKEKDVRYERAKEDFEEGLIALRASGREAVEAVETDLEATISKARDCYQLTAELLDVAVQRQQEVRNSEDQWVAGGNQLLKLYRDINTDIRDESTIPSYFGSYPSASDYRKRNFGVGLAGSDEIILKARAVDDSIKELIALRDDAKKLLEDTEHALTDVRRQVVMAIKSLDARLDEETLKITKDIEAEIRNREMELQGGSAPAPSEAV